MGICSGFGLARGFHSYYWVKKLPVYTILFFNLLVNALWSIVFLDAERPFWAVTRYFYFVDINYLNDLNGQNVVHLELRAFYKYTLLAVGLFATVY